MKHITYLVLLSISTSVLAGQVTVPNTFVANTPAVAADVNENFSTLTVGINDNASNIELNATAITTLELNADSLTVGVATNSTAITGILSNIDANTINIGINSADIAALDIRITDMEAAVDDNTAEIEALKLASNQRVFRVENKNGEDIGTLLTRLFYRLDIISDVGYAYNVITDTGLLTDAIVYYTNPDCTGAPHVAPSRVANGTLFQNGGTMYYVHMDAIPNTVNHFSYMPTTGGCTTAVGSLKLYTAAPNDPIVTGVPNVHGTDPFKIVVK